MSVEVESRYSLNVENDRCFTSYLVNELGKSLSDFGDGDSKIDKEKEGKIARFFGDAIVKSHFRYANKFLLGYNGYKYEYVFAHEFESLVLEIMEHLGVGVVYCNNSIPSILRHCMRKITRREYKPKKNIIALRNGVVDLDSVKMGEVIKIMPHSPKFEPCAFLDVDFDPRAKCDRFRRYLMEALPDESLQRVVQEFAGCMFVDRKKFKMERIMYFLGGGRNGKGVISDMIKKVAGEENYESFSMQELLKDGTRAYNVATADGKLLNLCSDMSATDVSGGEFKTYVSGEPMMARLPYGLPFKATNPPILIAAMNKLPVVTDHTRGQHDRVIIIPFDRYFREEEQDTTLGQQLESELSGFFNWVIEGRQRFVAQKGHFSQSDRVNEEKKKAKAESNSATKFLCDSYYEPTRQDYTNVVEYTLNDLYRLYVEYCSDNGYSAFNKQNLGSILTAEGYLKVRKTAGMSYVLHKRVKFDDNKEKIDEVQNGLPF